ncbi:MAG: nucleoside triphosphate pyrophosphohydrolase [Acidobacteria bacterium]|nr:nucleoside triphosphate pyrophosphohydrolase [Acidobacteriota bacterium]
MEDAGGSIGARFEELVQIMARLRGPDGCPWDLKQSFDSIKPYTLEEVYEVFDAIDRRDMPALSEELGDYLLQAVFYAQMAAEQGHFTISDSLQSINEKLIRRHPHIFGSGVANTAEEVKQRWDEIKLAEEASKGEPSRQPMLSSVLKSQPALAEAQQLTRKAAEVGFDWENSQQVLAKLTEELQELATAPDPAAVAAEMGDVLFVVVNLARKLGVDAEQALRLSNAKFRSRFGFIENRLDEAGRQWKDSSLAEMDAIWNEAKQAEKRSAEAAKGTRNE